MKTGTKSVLFGVHQFLLHPLIVFWAWRIIYKDFPTLAEWCAIFSHDLGYFGSQNMDDHYGEEHPERIAKWWRDNFGDFGREVSEIVLGHSRYHAKKNNLPLSKLFKPDKLASALYPRWLYLILANLSGEIHEYMGLCKFGKYSRIMKVAKTQTQWHVETMAHMSLMGLHGDNYQPVKEQMSQEPVLEWSKTLLYGKEVSLAKAEAAVKELGDGWRLPTRVELESLLDLTRHNPAINTDKFPDTASTGYWTSTPCAWNKSARWVVHFDDGLVYGGHGYDWCVRAVRSGQ